MKVVYICPGTYSPVDGIYQKVTKKTEFWTKFGITSTIVTYNDIKLTPFQKTLLKIRFPFLKAVIYYLIFASTVNKICRSVQPDLIYTRHFFLPSFFYNRCKLVLEVNGDVLAETKSQSRPMRFLVSRSVAHYNKHADAIVCVGTNLGEAFKNFKRQIMIPNPILATSDEVLENFRSHSKIRSEMQNADNIVFMATKNRPHYSLDFIVDFTAMLKKPHTLNIIGDIKLKSINSKKKNHVKILGPLSGDNLKKALQESKVAIGFLEYGNVLASPLKTRTYIEYGLPVFGTGNDCDFDESLPYYRGVKIDGNKSPELFARALDDFLDSEVVRNPPALTELPQQIKKVCLDYREKEIIDFLKSV